MSVLDVLARPRAQPGTAPTRGPNLELVPRRTPSAAPRVPFVLLVLAILGVGLVGLLLLNTQLQQGSFVLHELEGRTDQLADRERVLEQRVARLEAPESLAARARLLGMVPDESPVFLRLGRQPADAVLLGDPVPATAPPNSGVSSSPGPESASLGDQLGGSGGSAE